MTRYKSILCMVAGVAAFLLFSAGMLVAQSVRADGYFVSVEREGSTAALQDEQPLNIPVVNLNTATADELRQLPGIGETRAAAIIAYRESSGGFESSEDIMEVSGIGEGIFNRLRDYITVDGD